MSYISTFLLAQNFTVRYLKHQLHDIHACCLPAIHSSMFKEKQIQGIMTESCKAAHLFLLLERPIHDNISARVVGFAGGGYGC